VKDLYSVTTVKCSQNVKINYVSRIKNGLVNLDSISLKNEFIGKNLSFIARLRFSISPIYYPRKISP